MFDPAEVAELKTSRMAGTRLPATPLPEGRLAARVFYMFDHGRELREIVEELEVPPGVVRDLWHEWLASPAVSRPRSLTQSALREQRDRFSTDLLLPSGSVSVRVRLTVSPSSITQSEADSGLGTVARALLGVAPSVVRSLGEAASANVPTGDPGLGLVRQQELSAPAKLTISAAQIEARAVILSSVPRSSWILTTEQQRESPQTGRQPEWVPSRGAREAGP